MTILSTVRPTAMVFATAATLLVGGFAGSADADTPSCHGMPATIVATSGTAMGTPGNDVIVASGYTTVDAGAGDDTICVDGIVPSIDAGPGNDLVDARSLEKGVYLHADLGTGADQFFGGSESDAVTSGAGPDHDVIDTGDNRDQITVSSSHADVTAGSGKDRVILEAGALVDGTLKLGRAEDRLTVDGVEQPVDVNLRSRTATVDTASFKLIGAEDVFATGHQVRIVGDDHRNVLVAYGCAQHVFGGGGSDRVKLEGDRDYMACEYPRGEGYGGPGRDVLRSAFGGDFVSLTGGPGFDTAIGQPRGQRTQCDAERERRCR